MKPYELYCCRSRYMLLSLATPGLAAVRVSCLHHDFAGKGELTMHALLYPCALLRLHTPCCNVYNRVYSWRKSRLLLQSLTPRMIKGVECVE
jgi:hypothetical protein